MCEYCRPHPRQAFFYEEAWDENLPYIKSVASPNLIHTIYSPLTRPIGYQNPVRSGDTISMCLLTAIYCVNILDIFQIRDKAKIRFKFFYVGPLTFKIQN